MTAALKTRLLTVDEYLAGELRSKKRHEYVGGHIYAMAGGRNIHNTIAGNVFGAMHVRLRGKPCQPFNSDTKVRVRLPTHTRFYYPDAMVVCEGSRPGETFQDHPRLIAEVVSPSTRRTDEGEKREHYITIPSLNAYLVIETESARIVVHRRTGNGFVAEVYQGLDAVIPLPELDMMLPLAEFYERVDFTAAAAESDDDATEFFGDYPREPYSR